MNPAHMRKIEELYREARNRQPDVRKAFLAQACDGDEDLRLAVESLLAQDTLSLASLRS